MVSVYYAPLNYPMMEAKGGIINLYLKPGIHQFYFYRSIDDEFTTKHIKIEKGYKYNLKVHLGGRSVKCRF
jgi:hypothetical protein